jgi:hypothetical protein
MKPVIAGCDHSASSHWHCLVNVVQSLTISTCRTVPYVLNMKHLKISPVLTGIPLLKFFFFASPSLHPLLNRDIVPNAVNHHITQVNDANGRNLVRYLVHLQLATPSPTYKKQYNKKKRWKRVCRCFSRIQSSHEEKKDASRNAARGGKPYLQPLSLATSCIVAP